MRKGWSTRSADRVDRVDRCLQPTAVVLQPGQYSVSGVSIVKMLNMKLNIGTLFLIHNLEMALTTLREDKTTGQ
jgi:hypothetical protein